MVERRTLSTLFAEKGLHGALFIAGEVLFITRPLIYVAFIRKYGVRSWIPWVLSLTVDFIGMGILSQVTSREEDKKEKIHLSESEQLEVCALESCFRISHTLILLVLMLNLV